MENHLCIVSSKLKILHTVEQGAEHVRNLIFNCIIYTLGIRHKGKDFSVSAEHHFECQKFSEDLVTRAVEYKIFHVLRYAENCSLMRSRK